MFGKIDTAEKLAICERQYQRHLSHMEDENYFEPLEDHSEDSITRKYKQNLSDIFHLDKIKDNQFYFLIVPSFEPENLLIIEKQQGRYCLTHIRLIKSYWLIFYADNKVANVESITSSSELKVDIGDSIFKLLNKTVIEARKPSTQVFVLDGTVYRLSSILNGAQKIVSKHSPDENSRSGKVIAIMEQLIENINNMDDAAHLSIKKMIDALEN